MSETVKSLFLKARALLNEYSEDGVLIPDADVIDLQEKAVPIVDMGHKELFEISRKDLTQAEPTTLASVDDLTEINYKADQALVYYLAARLAPFKKKELVAFFETKFAELKATCANKSIEYAIIDAYAEEGD